MSSNDGWITKGLSIKICFQADWDRITEIFSRYNSKLRRHGSTLTVNELKNVDMADKLTQELKNNKKIRQWASRGVGIVEDEEEYEKEITRIIFEKLLWLIPEFNRQYSSLVLKKYLTNGNTNKELECLFTTNGPVHSTRFEVEALVTQLIKTIK